MHSWLVVEVSQIEYGNIWFDSSRVLKLFAAALPFWVSLSQSVHWHPWWSSALLNCCTDLFLEIYQWKFCTDRDLTLNMTSTFLEHLELGPGLWLGHMCWPGLWPGLCTCGLATCAGLAHNYCIASEQKWQKELGHCCIVKNTWKTVPQDLAQVAQTKQKAFQLSPSRLCSLWWNCVYFEFSC